MCFTIICYNMPHYAITCCATFTLRRPISAKMSTSWLSRYRQALTTEIGTPDPN